MVIKALVPERDPKVFRTIIGLDTSSQGIAWTHLYEGRMIGQGKIDLTKKRTMQDKLLHVYQEWRHILHIVRPDHVFVEKSIFVKSPGTARTLSYIVGAIMIVSLGEGYDITDVEPSSWKSWLGYKNLRKGFVADAKEVLGTKHKKFCDDLRKSQTWRVIKHNYPDEAEGSLAENDHDIADSWGVALYGHNLLSEELTLEKSREITLDLAELDKLGLRL